MLTVFTVSTVFTVFLLTVFTVCTVLTAVYMDVYEPQLEYLCTYDSPVPRAEGRGQPGLRGAAGELHLLRGGRALQVHDPARLQGGGQEAQEAIRRLQLRWQPRRAEGLRGEEEGRAADHQDLPEHRLRGISQG